MFNKKPLPTPDLVNVDYAKIEKRVIAQMAEAFGVPDKMVRHGLNAGQGTPTGRKPSGPETQKLSTPKD